jgi:hypothetical protein
MSPDELAFTAIMAISAAAMIVMWLVTGRGGGAERPETPRPPEAQKAPAPRREATQPRAPEQRRQEAQQQRAPQQQERQRAPPSGAPGREVAGEQRGAGPRAGEGSSPTPAGVGQAGQEEALERLERVLELYGELLSEMERLRGRLSEKLSKPGG